MKKWWVRQMCFLILAIGLVPILAAQNGENTIVLKLKREYSNIDFSALPHDINTLWQNQQLQIPESIFKVDNLTELNYQFGIDLFREVRLVDPYKIHKVVNQLSQLKYFEYVEVKQIGQLAFVPNDAQFNQQTYLTAIGAQGAWDSTQGSANIIVALLDAGVDTTHEDLKGKFWKNNADPKNGIDDDGDGFTDNFNGWNFNLKNDNIQFSSSPHGIQMAGVIAPQTNNSKGIAGIGFKTSILPLYIVDNSNSVVYGYEAIKYAADKNADIINCSWNIKSYSQFGHDMVKYATAKGSLVVAAMGNQNANDKNYPAMFPEVLGVSAVDNNGYKVSNSNYAYSAGIAAPGLQILTTTHTNQYKKNTGTSLSSAIVSGGAALLKSKRSHLSPVELMATLRASSKSVYSNGQNGQYMGQLGSGMINLHNALRYDGSAYPELISYKAFDPSNGSIESGDTIEIEIELTNYLANSGVVVANLESQNLHSVVVSGSATWPTIAKNKTVNNSANRFKVALSSSAPLNEVLEYSVQVLEGGDTSYFGFSITVNSAYKEINTGVIKTCVANRSTIGWHKYPQKEGIGVEYKGKQLLYECGLMIGQKNAIPTVVDRIRGVRDVEQENFETIVPLAVDKQATAPIAYVGEFGDANGKGDKLGVEVKQQARAWPNQGVKSNFVIMEYEIYSTGSQLSNIYVGLVSDWDIEVYDKNRSEYQHKRYMNYSYSTQGIGPYCGTQILSSKENIFSYSIDHVNGGAGGIDLTDNDVFSKAEKMTTLCTSRLNSGAQQGGNDVMQVISAGPYTIEPGIPLKFKVAILVGKDLTELETAADTAFQIVNSEIPNSFQEVEKARAIKVYPNPANDQLNIDLNEEFNAKIQVFNSIGKEVIIAESLSKAKVTLNIAELDKGVYIIRIHTDGKIVNKHFVKS